MSKLPISIQKETLKVGIVGLDRATKACVYTLLEKDSQQYEVKISIFTSNPEHDYCSEIRAAFPDSTTFFSYEDKGLLQQNLIIVASSVIVEEHHTLQLALDYKEVQERHKANSRLYPDHITIISDLELFYQIKSDPNNASHKAKIIGITGSNGKTIVAELTKKLLDNYVQLYKKRVVICGDKHYPFASTEVLHSSDIYCFILEINARQLALTKKLNIDIGAILNTAKQAQENFVSKADYIAALQHIYDFSDTLLFKLDDVNTAPTSDINPNNSKKHMVAFSGSEKEENRASYFYDPISRTLNIPLDNGGKIRSIPEDAFKLKGKHNYENILAALAIARNILDGETTEAFDNTFIETAQNFDPIPHCYQPIENSNTKVLFLNDSKATNIGATISALESTVLNPKQKLWLLLGGNSNNQDFSLLTPYLSKPNITTVCYGRDAAKIAAHCPNPFIVANDGSGTLEQALNLIAGKIKNKDVVLLSPACSPDDQFASYQERGNKFKELAQKFNIPTFYKIRLLEASDFIANSFKRALYFGEKNYSLRGNKGIESSPYDGVLLTLIAFIFGLGIIAVMSSSVYLSFFSFKHIIILSATVIVFATSLAIPTSFYNDSRILISIIIGALVLLGMVLLIGHSVNGSKRWINLGYFTIQPAEFAKYACFLYLGHYCSQMIRYQDYSFRKSIFYWFYVCLIAITLILQPDIGTTAIIVLISAITIVFFINDINSIIRNIFFLITICFLLAVIIVSKNSYILNRFSSFLNPFDDPFGQGYQTIQSLAAIAHGKLFGTGLGNSIFKTGYLTEANTDYILAIILEELGSIMMIVLTLLYGALFIRIIKISHQTLFYYKDRAFQAIVCFNFALWFAYQTFYSMMMVNSFLPVDGNTLPLISYGGSSYFITMFALGFVIRTDYENRLMSYQVKDTNSYQIFGDNLVVTYYQPLNYDPYKDRVFHAKDILLEEEFYRELEKQHDKYYRTQKANQQKQEKMKQKLHRKNKRRKKANVRQE